MNKLCTLLLLAAAPALLNGCGILGHNLGRLGRAIPDLSSLSNPLQIEYSDDTSHAVEIRDGRIQGPGIGIDE